MKNVLQFLKFLFFSLSAGLIQIGSFALFNEIIKLPYWVSYLVSLLLSVLWNFTLNRKFTFKSANNVGKAMLLTLAFYAVFTPCSTYLEKVLTSAGVNEYLVTIINMVLNFILEFFWQKFVVFKEEKIPESAEGNENK